jgi:hypothetical protein
MVNVLSWLFRSRCLRHAEPIFDRDPSGNAIFRCPQCLATWPRFQVPQVSAVRAPVEAPRPQARRRRSTPVSPKVVPVSVDAPRRRIRRTVSLRPAV